MLKWTLLFAAVLALASCGNQKQSESGSALTEHQRDSVLARSSLPGASTVGRALAESERASHHAADLDSLTR